MTDKPRVKEMLADLESQNARLLGIIADAQAAMDEGRYGDARRILRTGKATALLPITGVIAKDGAA